jgi:hypothetical protein
MIKLKLNELSKHLWNGLIVYFLQKDLELELKENKAKQERCIGKAIYYGESVQLRHTMTKKYLAVSSSDTSLTENTKLKVRSPKIK